MTKLKFPVWILFWLGVFGIGAYAGIQCFVHGLNLTGMDNRFVFGLWIFMDLAIIALGAGAFFTGLLLYVFKRSELKEVINTAVVTGFICYSGAVAALLVDIGQPLRFWFAFRHPNIHSMLAEVTACITCYLTVLILEYAPLILRNKSLKRIPELSEIERKLHRPVVVLAVLGAFLSFFHQGSLGGLYGVLSAKPFSFREGLSIWPSTFFLFIVSAVAAGPSFLLLINKTIAKIAGRKFVSDKVYDFLGKLSGGLLCAYVLFKALDTLMWLNDTAPAAGATPYNFYRSSTFGTWILILEIFVCGVLPAVLLVSKRLRAKKGLLVLGAFLCCTGVVLNRFVQTIQSLALPTLPFDNLEIYMPTWQETAVTCAVVAYGVLIFSFSIKYLPMFPHLKK